MYNSCYRFAVEPTTRTAAADRPKEVKRIKEHRTPLLFREIIRAFGGASRVTAKPKGKTSISR